MTEDKHRETIRRNPLLEAAHEEMIKFERKENEFRKRDREERASELHLCPERHQDPLKLAGAASKLVTPRRRSGLRGPLANRAELAASDRLVPARGPHRTPR